MLDIKETFGKFSDEYLEFEKIENPMHHRKDVCAFLLMDKLIPSNKTILSAAWHDEVAFSIDIDELSKVATEEDILTLVRCGVRYSKEYECLTYFV